MLLCVNIGSEYYRKSCLHEKSTLLRKCQNRSGYKDRPLCLEFAACDVFFLNKLFAFESRDCGFHVIDEIWDQNVY